MNAGDSSTVDSDAKALLAQHRWAGLATNDRDGRPYASMVAYALYPQSAGVLFFLSRLSAHTRHLLSNGECSLVISQVDDGLGDPQTLARLTLQGQVNVIARTSSDFDRAKASYCRRLPQSERLFEFSDFVLFHFQAERGRCIAGFGRAHELTSLQLSRVLSWPDSQTR